MTETEVKAALRSWIAQRNGKISLEEIDDDTPLIENRVVSSLHAMELLAFVERLRGRKLDIAEIKPRMLQSVASIYRGFFGVGA